MIKDSTITELAKRAGISPEKLQKAIKSEGEETLTFDDEGEFISHAELDSIKERAGKESYKEGKIAGEEMTIKAIKNDEGLEIDGKNRESVIRALKEKILKEAGSEPTKKIQDLENDNKKLRENLTEKENELKSEIEKFTSRLSSIEIEAAIKSNLPEKLANGLTRDDAFLLYKAKRNFHKTEKGIELIDPKTGEVMKDKKLNLIPLEVDLKAFAESFGEVSDQGRGAGDNIPKPKTNIESMTKRTQVENYFETNNIPQPQQAAILAKAMKNEGFDMNA
jgi:hypothetical protein